MTPVDQTLFYDPALPLEEQRGNCVTAVIASLLDLPIDGVPNFVQEHVDSGGAVDWWDAVQAFVRSHGWELHHALPIAAYQGQHLWVGGPSPRAVGLSHAVIWRDGQLVHDPHPDRTGIAAATSAYGLYRPDEPAVRA